jgi:hypothetical protein
MMVQQRRTESLFYYFRLDEQIPTDHLLRLRARAAEGLLQAHGPTIDRSRSLIANVVSRLSLWNYERTAFSG